MRAVLAIAAVVVLLLGAAAPHVHGGRLGTHECAACAVGTGEQPEPRAVAAPPGLAVSRQPVAVAVAHPVTGAPLGAVPGQSPPAA